jgi:predicted kinase
MEKVLYIVRGLPGSGKSTFAKTLAEYENHYEADMFFMKDHNEYKFDATKLKEAHNWCRDLVMMAMLRNENKIVVSNTFTQEWEMDAYFDLAKKHGYKVFSIIMENRHDGKNVHGCPEETIDRMEARFDIKLK